MGFLAKGVPAIAVAALANEPLSMGLTVGKNSPIKTPDDLKGALISVATGGSLTFWLAHEFSRQRGWGPNGIRTVALGVNPAQVAALKSEVADLKDRLLRAHAEVENIRKRAEREKEETAKYAITKLAHIHFPATTTSAMRIVAMGENPSRVHVVGSPAIDCATDVTATSSRWTAPSATRSLRHELEAPLNANTMLSADLPKRPVGRMRSTIARVYHLCYALTANESFNESQDRRRALLRQADDRSRVCRGISARPNASGCNR
jgi:hypothetical protein